MIILYIEETARRAHLKIDELFNTFANPAQIIRMAPGRRLKTPTGLEFIAIHRGELDRVRGLNLAAVFVNCKLTVEDQWSVVQQIRPQARIL